MRCEDVQSRLIAYAAGELTRDEYFSAQAHLRECVRCRAALGRVDQLAACLSQAPSPPPEPAGLAGRILDAAQARGREAPVSVWGQLSWSRMAPALARGVAVMIFIIGLIVGLAMGATIIPSGESRVGPQATMRVDPLDIYKLDALDDAPDESLAALYISLASERDQEAQ